MNALMSSTVLQPWPLDYSWCSRQGVWTQATDVLLEGQTCTQRPLELVLGDFFAALKRGEQRMLDNSTESGYWIGGVFLYVTARRDDEVAAPASCPAQIWLHSRGQDAMDSLAWVSQRFCDALAKSQQCLSLGWVEHPHARDHRIRRPLT